MPNEDHVLDAFGIDGTTRTYHQKMLGYFSSIVVIKKSNHFFDYIQGNERWRARFVEFKEKSVFYSNLGHFHPPDFLITH